MNSISRLEKVENTHNKRLYKLFLFLLKVIPIVSAFFYWLNTTLAYFEIDIPILSYLGGMSFYCWLLIYIATYVFNFCSYQRVFLYYILICNIINIIDYHYTIPLSDFNLLVTYYILSGLSLFLFLLLYLRNKNKR